MVFHWGSRQWHAICEGRDERIRGAIKMITIKDALDGRPNRGELLSEWLVMGIATILLAVITSAIVS